MAKKQIIRAFRKQSRQQADSHLSTASYPPPKLLPQTQEFSPQAAASFLSSPPSQPQQQRAYSAHDLRSLGTNNSNEPPSSSSNRRARYRARKHHRSDDKAYHSFCEPSKNSSSDSMPDARSPSRNHLAPPSLAAGQVASSRSVTQSNSSQESTEYADNLPRRPPEPLQGPITKTRKWPMKGWHERYFSLKNGILSYAKNETALSRGKNVTQIELANVYISFETEKLRADIDATTVVYHLKFRDSPHFQQWSRALKEHREFDQYRSGLKAMGRPGTNLPSAGGSYLSSGSRGSLSLPEEAPPQRPTHLSLQVPVSSPASGPVLRNARPTIRLSNEHITALEKIIWKLENAYQSLQTSRQALLESNIPDTETATETIESPGPSVFFSPVPFAQAEVPPSSAASWMHHHARVNSFGSTTSSMCTAIQAVSPAATLVPAAPSTVSSTDHLASKPTTRFLDACANFTNDARRFIEEANEALASIHQANQVYALGYSSPNKDRNSTTQRRRRSPDSDSESDGSEPANSGDDDDDSNSEPMLLLGKTAIPAMNDVVVKQPEHVVGRRTTLPAKSSNHTTFSLLTLLRSNIGRDLTKIRLPTLLNEPLSFLQNLCEEMEYSELLDAAVEMKDRMQRMLYVTTFAISGYACTAKRTAIKSFNPLLGETFECVRPEKNWRFLAEQVSHNPPISASHCESKLWVFDEECSMKYRFWGKSLEVNPVGACQLTFHRWRETYTWNKVTTSVTNLVSPGGRQTDHSGDLLVLCSNGISCKVHFSKADLRRREEYRSVFGSIQPPPGSSETPRTIHGFWDKILASSNGNNEDRCIWIANALPVNSMQCYGFTSFAIELNEPAESEAVPGGWLPLTDSRLRPDVRFLETGHPEDAEVENKRLEDEQRRRLKVADPNTTPWKPLWFTYKPKPTPGTSYEFNPAYWRCKESAGFKDVKLPVLW